MSGKIIVVTSVVQGNGAKYVATNLAFEMQKKSKGQKKVLLVDFDFENPYLAYEYVKNDTVHNIDNISTSIFGEGLSDELFMDNIIHTAIGVDVLRGTKSPDRYKTFTKEIIETILQFAKKHYDYVFVVTTNKATNAGTVYSIFHADKILIVARNNNSNMMRIEKVIKMLLQYYGKEDNIMMVYNHKNHSAKSEVNSKLVGTNVSVVGILEYEEKSIDNIDLEKRMSAFGGKSINFKQYIKILDMLSQN